MTTRHHNNYLLNPRTVLGSGVGVGYFSSESAHDTDLGKYEMFRPALGSVDKRWKAKPPRAAYIQARYPDTWPCDLLAMPHWDAPPRPLYVKEAFKI